MQLQGEETILNVLDKRIKETQNAGQGKKKAKLAEPEIEEEIQGKPKGPSAFATSYQKLMQKFGLAGKKDEHDEDIEIRKDFESWASKLGCQKLVFTPTDKPYDPSHHFDFDPEVFTQQHLTENTEEVAISGEKQPATASSKFELKLQEDLDQGHKEIFKKMLDDVHFESLRYKKQLSNSKYRTAQFIFEYTHRTSSHISKGEIEYPKELTAIAPELEESVVLNTEILGTLAKGLDISILDHECSLIDEYNSTILHYIHAYLQIHEKLRQENKRRLDQAEAKAGEGKTEEEIELIQCNGFVRPRALIAVTYRHEAMSIILRLYELAQFTMKDTVKQRLDEEFSSEDTAFEDNFIIGLAFSSGKIQITQSLAHADLLISTTAHIISMNSDSVLSSIEVLYLHKLSDLAMQNFFNLAPMIARLNKVPDHAECTEDFRTIRPVHSSGLASFVRQTIVYSEYTSLELNSFVNKSLLNYKGVLKSKQFYPCFFKGSKYPSIEYAFKKVEIESLKTEFDEKFNFFRNQVWDRERKEESLVGSLLVVNDYLQYKHLKKYFKEKSSPVGYISEHSPKSKVQSVFAKFNTRKNKYILITERALYFQICEPKKFEALIFIGLPYNLRMFEGLLEELLKAQKPKMVVVFSKKDSYELEKVIGTPKTVEFILEKNRFKILDV